MSEDEVRALEGTRCKVRPKWAKTSAHWHVHRVDGEYTTLTTNRGKKLRTRTDSIELCGKQKEKAQQTIAARLREALAVVEGGGDNG